MVPETHSADVVGAVPDPERNRPDDFFAIVVGFYAAVVLGPLAVAAAAPVLQDAGALYVALLSCGTVLTVGVAVAARRPRRLPERIGATRYRWSLVAAPIALVPLAYPVFTITTPAIPGEVGLLLVLSAVGGTIVGSILATMATTRHAKAVCAHVETDATWRAGWPTGRRRPTGALAVGLLVVGAVGLAVGFAAEIERAADIGRVLLYLWFVPFIFGQERTYRATPAGLELQAPASRRLFPWESFAGYGLTDDAIVLRRRAWWRLPLYCARPDIEDEGAVLDALARYLDRV